MKCSNEIKAMDCSENKEANDSNQLFSSGYRMGYSSARSLAGLVAATHDANSDLMADALGSINLDDQDTVLCLGDETIFKIRYALKAYREQVEG